jgi:acylphosphatase
MKTLQILVIGRVQGVGFRACVRRIASDMNIRGTVMNLPDGKVQIYATGEPIT